MRRLLRLFALLAVAATCLPATAAADPYPVKTTADSGADSLRAAILAADTHPGADTIPIEVTGTIDLQSALPVVFDPLSITGPGADLLEVRRSAATDFPIFIFASDANPSSLTGLTISNGRAGLGAGITNVEGSLTLTRVVVSGNEVSIEGGSNAVAEGGGILSEGPLTLRETMVVGNFARARDGTSESVAAGAGIVANGRLTVERSTISDNLAEAIGGDLAYARGGGLLSGEATIELSTISGNSVRAKEGGIQNRAQGGGFDTAGAGLTGSTLTGNSVYSEGEAFGANLNSFSASATLVDNTIIANPVGDAESCNGFELASGGFNLDEDSSCEFEQATDLEAVDPLLGPLTNNGGPTPTHALLESSAAIDRGSAFGSAIDQRGLTRPVDFATRSNTEGGDGSDIGAFELQATPLPALPGTRVTTVAGDRQPPNTRIVSGPARVSFKRLAKFRFASTEAQSSFQCKVDKGRWRGCRNPFKRKVGAGARHLFKVRAIDRFGNVDSTPARFGWRVKVIRG